MKSFLKGLEERDIARNGNFCFSWLFFWSGVNYDTLLFHLPLFSLNSTSLIHLSIHLRS
jgi:hypothetical protein